MIRRWARRALLVALLLIPAPLASAQEGDPALDPNPLRPADTSSPRDTLRSFLTNADRVIMDWKRRDINTASYMAFLRALETLDFSTTPNGNSWSERTTRAFLLQELLARIDLPPEDQIPGEREVSEEAITQWSVPGTRIKIDRIEKGPRAGEFLFSAGTVAQLDRLYRQAKHLPYQPGATPGAYEELARSEDTEFARESALRDRLKPVDTSSPQSTLEGFLDSVNRAYALIMETRAALKASPSTMAREEVLEIETKANDFMQRAVATLDLSRVPIALRTDVGIETALRLKEIIDRMQLPPLASVPNAEMVAAARLGTPGSFSQSSGPLRWRLPNSEIEIVEIVEGEQQGSFLFSAVSVERMRDYYNQVQDVPYRQVNFGGLSNEHLSPYLTPGFYDFYVSTPGYLIPNTNLIGKLVDGLPGWLKTRYGEQTLWQLIALCLSFVVLVVAAYVISRVVMRLAADRRPPLDAWLLVLPPIVIAIFAYSVREFLDRDLNLTGDVLSVVVTVDRTIILAMGAWAVWSGFNAVAETIIALRRAGGGGLDANLFRVLARLFAVVVGVWIVLQGLQDLGAEIVPLLAGLGVGGIAVALAVRPTLENLIGGLILYFDKPVRVGDFCAFGSQTGTVESIGLRSTHIRGLDRTLIAVPNAKFADMEIINWAQCDSMLIDATIGLRYETDPDQLRYVLAKVREMFHAHPKIDSETVRVRFSGYGASSLDVTIRVYALTRDWNEYFAIREDGFLRIKDIVKESGTGFAFPSQTLYMGRDDGLDDERGEAAADEVKFWRRSGRLPFPRLSASRMAQLEDTLDYPPRGSVESGSRAPQAAEPLSTEPLSSEPLSTEPLSTEPQSSEPESEDRNKKKEPSET